MSLADELQKLQELRRTGAISEEEFARAKANLFNAPPANGAGSPATPAEVEHQTRLWAMILHLTQLANFVVPLSGIVLPIVIWQIMKADLPGIDVHGRNVTNWIISTIIYLIGSILLLFCVVGFIPLIVLAVVGIVFPIIGAVKANNGEAWKYPLTITFLQDPTNGNERT